MKKVVILLLLVTATLTAFSQSKDSSSTKKPEVVTAKVVSDTLVVSETTAKFIKLNGRIIPADVLKTEMLPVSLEWIVTVFQFITGSKNSDYTVDQIDKIRQPLFPYIEYVQRLQQQQKKQ